MNLTVLTRWLVRVSLAGLFGYFGVMAVMDPSGQAAIWMQPWVQQLIASFLPVTTMTLITGVLQIVIAVILVVGRPLIIGLSLASLLLIGIIVNLGFNDVSLRDTVILMTVLYLLAQEIDARR